jgi:tetratricopeptide (TPR) repeat protein
LCHELVELFPKKPVTWFGVGTYYLTIQKYTEARRYFGKATAIEPNFAHAWIGFAHSFALEGEHDSAVSVYSSACKVLPGSHIPQMYLGMEHARQKNWKLAEEFLLLALKSCSSDPLLHNELGSLYFEKGQFESAIKHFMRVLELVGDAHPHRIWMSTLCNLGHTYRKMENYSKAKSYFEKVNELSEAQESAYSGLALIAQAESRMDEAVYNLHQALAINPDNRICALVLESLLIQIANKDSSNPLPLLDEYLDPELIEAQLQNKLSKESSGVHNDDQDPILGDPDEFSVGPSDDDVEKPPENSHSITNTVLKSRLSNAIDLSPDVFASGRPRRGPLNFHGSSPVYDGSRTPPRQPKVLFASREDSPFQQSNGFQFEDSDVFGGDQDIDMELDDSD